MSNSSHNNNNYPEEEEEFIDDEDFNSDDSDQDPSYNDVFLKAAQSSFSKLSIDNKPNIRNNKEKEVDDEGVSSQKLNKEDVKTLEQVQKVIDCGQVEKLKVDQCKIYLRNHGLRLTGKKEVLIQRIKEHVEILNGGGEKKYPPSSFVLNCKGDACLGDIVMFEQTVYEEYSIVSRSACGPPCGTRIVAGRIVNESYGAAKQQHTFTVEVLWSKGEKPLPPLHPLLIKGRNLYKLETRRQKWDDEAERKRVLDEKHIRGIVARSNREARIQEKMTKKSLKGIRVNSKNKENQCHQKESKQSTNPSILNSQMLGPNVHSKAQPSHFHHEPRAQNSYLGHGNQPHVEYRGTLSKPVSIPVSNHHHHQDPRLYSREKENSGNYPFTIPNQGQPRNGWSTSSRGSYSTSDRNPPRRILSPNYKKPTGPSQRPSPKQKLCRYYPQSWCPYGSQCKFLHESGRNYC